MRSGERRHTIGLLTGVPRVSNYTIAVHFADEPRPRRVETFETAQQVLVQIPLLLQEHADCEKMIVTAGTTRLFSVDGEGNRLPD